MSTSLALRRLNLRSASVGSSALRTYASAAAPTSPSAGVAAGNQPASATPTETQGRKKRHSYAIRRPKITLENPREWCRPVPEGVLPAYDEALAFVRADSESLKKKATELKVELGRVRKEAEGQAPESEAWEKVKELEEKVQDILLQSEVNLPDIRWKAKNGMADLTKPVYRHLVEQRWRKEGALDLLMERIHQMHVIPDVLPDLHPSLDMRVTFPKRQPSAIAAQKKTVHEPVEPGVFLVPQQTREAPNVYTTVFHEETRLYTLVMVDPDVPDEANASFQNYVHWLQPNIPLSLHTTRISIPAEAVHTPYVPPHPQQGTPYHRYTLLLLPQSGSEPISIAPLAENDRLGFDVRAFLQQHNLTPELGGGAHMFRQVWDEEVSAIYKDILRRPEPKFGREKTMTKYDAMKMSKRYISPTDAL